jgi:hypothetical protein
VGAGFDVGAFELQILTCGDGLVDPGEQCGEPGLGCADPCTSCRNCLCALDDPVCGDGLVCGDETCEADNDCGSGEACESCRCVNRPACESGIGMAKASLRLRAEPFSLRLKGEAVIPRPWRGVDPVANGVRVVVDALRGAGGVDATMPGGALQDGVGWKVNDAGTRWTYTDPAGSRAGVTRVVLQDRSSTADGLLRWTVQARGGVVTLPDASQVRTAVVAGDALECAAILWNPPGGLRPRCGGDGARLSCR